MYLHNMMILLLGSANDCFCDSFSLFCLLSSLSLFLKLSLPSILGFCPHQSPEITIAKAINDLNQISWYGKGLIIPKAEIERKD